MSVPAAGLLRAGAALAGAAALVACTAPQYSYYDRYYDGPIDYPGWREEGAFHFGERSFADSGLMSDGDDQFVMGLELYGAPENAFVAVEFGFWASAPYNGSLDDWFDSIGGYPDEEQDDPDANPPTVDGSSSLEFSLGLRKELVLADGWIRPYVSTGGSLMRARSFVATGADGVEEGDTTWGWYGQAGIHIALGYNARVGLAFRFFEGDSVELLNVRGQPDYQQVTFTLGFSY